MTNILEKLLLTGFGIFTLILFFTIITPFFRQIEEYQTQDRDDLEQCITFINEIDTGILYVIENSNSYYLKNIEYPENMDVLFDESYVKFDYILENKTHQRILQYNATFFEHIYQNLPPQTYLLNISYRSALIEVCFS